MAAPFRLTDDQLVRLMAVASPLPTDKRATLLQRIGGHLRRSDRNRVGGRGGSGGAACPVPVEAADEQVGRGEDRDDRGECGRDDDHPGDEGHQDGEGPGEHEYEQ